MMMRDQTHHEKIVAEGKHEEGGVQNSHDKWPKIPKVKQKMKKRAKGMGHEGLFLRIER